MTNQSPEQTTLGTLIRNGRATQQISIRELSTRSDIPRSTLLDLEQDAVSSPKPAQLQALSTALDVELADLYDAAGYSTAEALPSFSPYLRSKYADLPASAQAELAQSFQNIARKYGYDANGPAPGQDEN